MGVGSMIKLPNHPCAVPSVTVVGPHEVPSVFTVETSAFTSDPVGRPCVDLAIDNSAHLGSPLFRPRRRVLKLREYSSVFYRYGMLAAKRGDLDRAASLYSRERNPRFIAPACNNAAAIRYEQGRVEEALRLLNKAFRADPFLPEIMFNFGKCFARLGQSEKAAPYFEFYLTTDPQDWEAHLSLADALDDAGRHDESIRHFKEAIRFSDDPNVRKTAYYNIGTICAKTGRSDEAVDAYWEAFDIDPHHFETLYNMGVIAFECDLPEAAEKLLEAAVTQRPHDVDGRYALGVLYFEQRRYEEASEQFGHLLKLDPAHVKAQIYLGIIAFVSERWELTGEFLVAPQKSFREGLDFKKAEVLEVMLLLARAGLHDERQEWEEARECLRSAAEKSHAFGNRKLAANLLYASTYYKKEYFDDQKKVAEAINESRNEVILKVMEDVGLSDSLKFFSDLERQQSDKLRELHKTSKLPEQLKSETAKLIDETQVMGADAKRQVLELFRQCELFRRHTPWALPPRRHKYPASRFFSGLIGDVFYNEDIRDEVERRLGVKPAKLSAGINYFEAPEVLLNKLIKSLDEYYQDYSHPFGGGEVRKAIAGYENALAGSAVYAEDNVAVTPGATGAIFFAFKFLEELRDAVGLPMDVLMPVPTYYVYGSTARYLRFGVEEVVGAAAGAHRFLPTPAEIEARMQQNGNIRMIALANPNNPTGEIYSPDELTEIVAIAKRYDSYILYDEIFSDMMLTNDPLPNITRIAQEQGYLDHILKVTSWSKDRCIPGFRVGYLVADQAVLSTISELPEWQYANPPTVLNGVIERDLTYRQMMDRGDEGDEDFESYEKDLQKNDTLYRENLRLVRERLADSQRFTILEPKAAFNMFVRINGMEGYDQWDFAEKLFVEKGVEVHPGPGFGLERHDWEMKHGLWIRISFAIERDELERGLNGLLEFVEECKSNPDKIRKSHRS